MNEDYDGTEEIPLGTERPGHRIGQCPALDSACDGIEVWQSDPYQAEIMYDYTPHWLCSGQVSQSAEEI